MYSADDEVQGLPAWGESKGGTGFPFALKKFFLYTINNTFKVEIMCVQ